MPDPLARLTGALADRYIIERELGAGGMATVYLARDVKHNRRVAVKVLKPELAAVLGSDRFLKEIEVTANLQHPRILPLYDSGTAGQAESDAAEFLFYVMPFADGESLRDRLNREHQLGISEIVELTKGIASALDYAHREGVVHRDVKPENIMLQHGEPVVADFGIALALAESGGERLTATGLSVGSPSYMSPEQVSGERAIDHRSDIYALGCVVYEMLVGEPPFTGPNPRAVMARQVTDAVPPIGTVRVDVPPHVIAAVGRALSKVPADRFGSAGELSRALAEPAPPSVGKERTVDAEEISVVVLPFANLSTDPGNEFIADGFTEEAISDLSAIGALKVISRTSAMRLKGSDKDSATIASDLGVRYVLEGSVRKSGENLRVTARLIDAVEDVQIWTDRYTGVTTDVFDIQEQVARGIVDALSVQLTPQEDRAIGVRYVTDPHAYESYLRARSAIWDFTVESFDLARRHLENALELVGDNELLLATLGHVLVFYPYAGAPADFDRAEQCAKKIFALNPDSPHGVWLRGIVLFQRGELRRARPDLEQAHVLLPDDPDVLLMLGYLLSLSGQLERAEELYDRALQLDPLTPLNHCMTGFNAILDGRPEDALVPYAKFLEMDPQHPMGLWGSGWVLLFNRRITEAAVAMERVEASVPGSPYASLARAHVLGARGKRDEAFDAISEELHALAATNEMFSRELTHCYALTGHVDEAIRWFENTVRIGSINYPFWAHHDWMLDTLRRDERFQRILQRVWDEWVQGVSPEQAAKHPRPPDPTPSTEPASARAVAAESRAPTVAVLPFLNRSPDPDTAFFADGVTDDIIAHLSKIRDLRVISRRSTERYRESEKGIKAIASDLGADVILEGTIRRAERRVRVVAQLIDAESDRNVWSETYDRELTDVFAIQSDIATNIAGALEMSLSAGEQEQLAKRPTEDLQAYDLYLLGQHHWTKRSDDGIRQGIEYFERALERDPSFTRAVAAMAEAYLFAGLGYASIPYREALSKAMEYARTAITMDDSLAEAHATLGVATLNAEWDVAASRKSVDRALAISPNLPVAHQWLAWCHLYDGALAAAFDAWEQALALDPLSAVLITESGWPFGYVGLYAEGRARFLRALKLEPNFALAIFNVGWMYDGEGKLDDAIEWYERAVELSGGASFIKAFHGAALVRVGKRRAAQVILEELRAAATAGQVDHLPVALVEEALGHESAALDALETAHRERAPFVATLGNAGFFRFERIRSHPRFQRLLVEGGFPIVDLVGEREKLERRLGITT